MNNIIDRLTYKLDYYGTGIEWGTVEDVKVNLWADLDNLRNSNNRNNLIHDWKYKAAFETTEQCHLQGRRSFYNLSLENSFALALLCAIYH